MRKNIKFIFFLFILSFIVNCNFFSGTAFNLTVLDENKNPVQNAEIMGGCGNGNIKGKTDENGKFSTKVQCVSGEGFEFFVRKDGYLEYRYTMDLFQYSELEDKRIILKKN